MNIFAMPMVASYNRVMLLMMILIMAIVLIPQDRVRVVVSDFEEDLDKSSFKDPRDYAIANACGKAKEVRFSLGIVPYGVASVI